ncbi:hypothetical protein BDN72DRAFT_833562 [Pluteus cervinus]|uniref:Uncharacterized protein n=1 Tax=Pluteus cervinus TaxID=181527 RepID=A0ACD3B8T2_9AGAR|nr:hypothetical protein BDN72DRAFT_833562 [Pluteus cervinus]
MSLTSPFTGLSQFIDLPLDIAEQIINILTPAELLALAKTCRQFNTLCLHRFFLLHKIDEQGSFRYRKLIRSLAETCMLQVPTGLEVLFML